MTPYPRAKSARPLSTTQERIRAMLPTLAVDLVVPLAVYAVLQGSGLGTMWSLVGAGAVPVVRIAVAAMRRGRMNGLALVVLSAVAVGVALTLVTGNPRLAIARDAVIGLVVGAAFIGSLALRRPLMFHIIRSLRGGQDLDAQWAQLPRLRCDLRCMTAIIGGLCGLDAAVRVLIAYDLPVHTAGAVVHFQPIVLVTLLMLVGKVWGERIRKYTHM